MTSPSPALAGVDLMARHRTYQALVGRLLDLVHGSVPPGATALVVSKGDGDLVSLVGRHGWHFPQDDSGGYAGYHPRDSETAIRDLEALRQRGADFLVLPATARWWLDHYADFASHLRRYETVADQPDTGIVYALRTTAERVPGEVPDDGLERHRRAQLAEQVKELAVHLLVPGQPVVVLDAEGGPPVELSGQPMTYRQLADPAGRAQPAPSGVALVGWLEGLQRRGAGWLVVTAAAFPAWQAESDLRSYVEQRHRLVTCQKHVCLIYQLEHPEEVAG